MNDADIIKYALEHKDFIEYMVNMEKLQFCGNLRLNFHKGLMNNYNEDKSGFFNSFRRKHLTNK